MDPYLTAARCTLPLNQARVNWNHPDNEQGRAAADQLHGVVGNLGGLGMMTSMRVRLSSI